MKHRRGRKAAVILGGISLGLGVLTSTLLGQVNSICGTSLVVEAAGRQAQTDCAGFSLAYHFGVALMVVGAVLIIGAFILSIDTGVEEDGFEMPSAQPPGWYRDPRVPDNRLRWWDGHHVSDPPPPPQM